MPTIFESIQPLTKNGRTTRSRSRYLQKIKRVISGVDDDLFEHFCGISLNNRISNLMNNNNSIYDPITINLSHQFLANHNVFQKSSIVCVTVNGLHDDSSVLVKRTRKKSTRMEPATTVSDIDDCTIIDNSSPQPNTSKTKSDEEDVIIVNATDDSVILIEDCLAVPNSDSVNVPHVSESQHKYDQLCTLPSYIPLVSDSHKCNGDENQSTSNVPIINILDEDVEEDIIFVKEEILNNTHLIGGKRRGKRKILSLANKAKQNQLVLNKRCVKCINVNAKLARSCPCKKGPFQSVLQQTSTNFDPVNVASNVFNPNTINRTGLREIVIDGSNLALGHTNGRCFSVKGLQIAIDYFIERGHKVVAFVPQYRQKHNQTTDANLLKALEYKGYVVFTPSREVNGRRITPYDDRYIIQYAAACEGIVVSNDNYRDLFLERIEWRTTIERRLLMPTWVGDVLMFPEDPLGRHGPSLSQFLRFP